MFGSILRLHLSWLVFAATAVAVALWLDPTAPLEERLAYVGTWSYAVWSGFLGAFLGWRVARRLVPSWSVIVWSPGRVFVLLALAFSPILGAALGVFGGGVYEYVRLFRRCVRRAPGAGSGGASP